MSLEGLFTFSVWGYVGIALLLTHVTIASVTIFLHRHQAHHALSLNPVVSHFFRFWLWLTTGIITREWIAIHRKHHARCETEDDPHSPRVKGILTVLFGGYWLYRAESRNLETLEKFGHGAPDDWLEKHVYSAYPWLGILLMALIDLTLFGLPGLLIFVVQMIWIPFWAAGVINGLGHYLGYRGFETSDASTNIVPWGILIGGEELHNNHHGNRSRLDLYPVPGDVPTGAGKAPGTTRFQPARRTTHRPRYGARGRQPALLYPEALQPDRAPARAARSAPQYRPDGPTIDQARKKTDDPRRYQARCQSLGDYRTRAAAGQDTGNDLPVQAAVERSLDTRCERTTRARRTAAGLVHRLGAKRNSSARGIRRVPARLSVTERLAIKRRLAFAPRLRIGYTWLPGSAKGR